MEPTREEDVAHAVEALLQPGGKAICAELDGCKGAETCPRWGRGDVAAAASAGAVSRAAAGPADPRKARRRRRFGRRRGRLSCGAAFYADDPLPR